MAATPQTSEIVSLLLAVFLVPITVAVAHRFRHPGWIAVGVGFVLMSVGILLAVAEHYVGGTPVTDAKYVIEAAGGAAFAVGWFQLNVAVRRGEFR